MSDRAEAEFRNSCQAYNLPEMVVSGNDFMALGVIKVLNEYGYNLGGKDNNYIPVFGIDAIQEALDYIENEKMEGTIMNRPEDIAWLTADMIKNYFEGNDLLQGTGYKFISTSKTVYTNYIIIVKE